VNGRPRARALALCILAASCHRAAPPPGDAGALADASPPPGEPSPEAHAPPPREPRWHGLPVTEARRARLAQLADDPALAPGAVLLRAHFGPQLFPLDAQSATLGEPEAGAGVRRALLLRGKDDARPMVVVVDARSRGVWSNDHPTAGLLPRVSELAIAPAPRGGTALFFYDPPVHVLGARRWDDEGGLLVDFELLDLPACDALSALYWPGRGWIVAAARVGETRAQLLLEAGGMAWGHDGVAIAASADDTEADGARGARGARGEPVSLVLDTDGTFMAMQRGSVTDDEGKRREDRLLAYRYDARGTPVWDAPRDLGPMPRSLARVPLERPSEGMVRALLPRPVTLASDGTVAGAPPR
jgi:hypothetical protein